MLRPRTAAPSEGENPAPASTASVFAPGLTGGAGTPAGVRPNRGAGAGWITPPTLMNMPRAALCGWAGASPGLSTGATHASEPSNNSTSSAWVRCANAWASPARRAGQPDRSYWLGRPAPGPAGRPAGRVVLAGQAGAGQAEPGQQLVVELRLEGADRHVLAVGGLVRVVERGATVEHVAAPLVLPGPGGPQPG